MASAISENMEAKSFLMVAPATKAIVVKVEKLRATGGGMSAGLPMAQIRLTSGPFSEMIGLVMSINLCRPDVFKRAAEESDKKEGGEASLGRLNPPRVATKKRPARRSAEAQASAATGDLVLIDVAANPSVTGNYLNVVGRVRNTSDHDLKFIKVNGSFEDRSGKLVRSSWSYCDPQTIAPGGIASFEFSTESDARIAGYKLDFLGPQAANPWVDRSGKNVHQ
jgi:hypothetical protein